MYGKAKAEMSGFAVSHPWHKNKNVPRMGHPGLCRWSRQAFGCCGRWTSVFLPIDDGRAEAADGVGEIDGVGVSEVVAGQDSLFGVRAVGQNMTAVNTGEQAAVYGRGEETAILLDEDVVDGAFGDFAAFVQKHRIVVACGGRGLRSFLVKRAMGGFVEVHRILRVDGMGADADAEGFG